MSGASGRAWRKLRARVLREETHCHLCDQAVDTTLPKHRPGSPEVDHIIPLTYGGELLSRDNAHLAHRHCNRLRWHGPIALARQRLADDPPRFTADGWLRVVEAAPVTSRQW